MNVILTVKLFISMVLFMIKTEEGRQVMVCKGSCCYELLCKRPENKKDSPEPPNMI
jgi:hypothetical protein